MLQSLAIAAIEIFKHNEDDAARKSKFCGHRMSIVADEVLYSFVVLLDRKSLLPGSSPGVAGEVGANAFVQSTDGDHSMLDGWFAETCLTDPGAPEQVVVVTRQKRKNLFPEVVVAAKLRGIAQD